MNRKKAFYFALLTVAIAIGGMASVSAQYPQVDQSKEALLHEKKKGYTNPR